MSKAIDLKIPSIGFGMKVAISLVVLFVVIGLTPESWGIKKWFRV